jgi:hypothetical protein
MNQSSSTPQMNMWVKKRRGMDPPFHCGLAGGNRHPRSVAASQPCRHHPRRQLSAARKTSGRAAEGNCGSAKRNGCSMSTARPGGCTGTSRAPLRQPRDGRFAARGTLLCTTWTSLSGGKRQTVKLLGSSSQWRKGSSSESRLTLRAIRHAAGFDYSDGSRPSRQCVTFGCGATRAEQADIRRPTDGADHARCTVPSAARPVQVLSARGGRGPAEADRPRAR